MVRSKWMKSVLAALASTGIALAQQAERVITVTEAGKPPQKCKVLRTSPLQHGVQLLYVQDLATGELMTLEDSPDGSRHVIGPVTRNAQPMPLPGVAPGKSMTVTEMGKPPQKAMILQAWRTADGQRAYQVQADGTGEMMTIVETGPTVSMSAETPIRALTTNIFHWGRSTTPPKGAPLPPPVMVAQTAPPPEIGAPAQAARTWPPAYVSGTQAPSFVVSAPPRMAVPADPVLPTPQNSRAAPATSIATTQPDLPLPPAAPARPVTVVTQPTTPAPVKPMTVVTQPTTLPPVSGSLAKSPYQKPIVAVIPSQPAATVKMDTNTVKPGQAVKQAPAAPALPGKTTQPVQAAQVQPAQPKDPRESWANTSKPVQTTVKPAAPTPPLQVAQVTPKPAPPRAPVQPVKPVTADPLAVPTQYLPPAVDKKLTVDPKVAQALKEPGKAPMTTVSVTRPPAGSPGAFEVPPPQWKPAKEVVVVTPAPTVHETNVRVTASRTMTDAGTPSMAVMTLPPTHAIPSAPQPVLPPGPQAAASSVTDTENAFTRAAPSQPPAQPGTSYNAFSSGSNEQSGMAMNGYPMPMAPGMPGQAPGMMARPMPAAPGYAMAPRAILPPAPPGAPYAPMQQAAYNPAMQQGAYPIQTVSARMPNTSAAPWQALPAASQLPAHGTLSTPQTIAMLHESLYPSQREWAADQLSQLDWRTNEQAVDALVGAAKEDPAATVRASCIRSLARMNVVTLPVVNMLQSMHDNDPRVQTEVEHALDKLVHAHEPTLRSTN